MQIRVDFYCVSSANVQVMTQVQVEKCSDFCVNTSLTFLQSWSHKDSRQIV